MKKDDAPSRSQPRYSTSRKIPRAQRKTTHNISTTPDAWEGLHDLSIEMGCSSISDLIEHIGLRKFEIIVPDPVEQQADLSTQISDLETRLKEFLDERLNNIFSKRELTPSAKRTKPPQ
jgi:uridine phosphorylase